jgi:hypothetical protein
MTLGFLAAKAGVSLTLLSRRAEAQNWGSVQAFYRAHTECVQKTDILGRRRSPAILTTGARRAFQLNSRSDSTSGPLPPR